MSRTYYSVFKLIKYRTGCLPELSRPISPPKAILSVRTHNYSHKIIIVLKIVSLTAQDCDRFSSIVLMTTTSLISGLNPGTLSGES